MKKLNRLAVKVLSVLLAIILLSSQNAFAWVHEDITTTQTRNLGNLTVDDVDYEGNGGVFDIKYGVTFTITGDNVEFYNNSATGKTNWSTFVFKGRGGAIYSNGYLNITGSTATFKNNSATEYGGAIFINSINKTINIGNYATFEGNNAHLDGGAISESATETTVKIGKNASFKSNWARQGGAINLEIGTMEIGDNATFTGNYTKFIKGEGEYGNVGHGGAIYNNATLKIGDNAYFEKNYVDGYVDEENCNGGAIYNDTNYYRELSLYPW